MKDEMFENFLRLVKFVLVKFVREYDTTGINTDTFIDEAYTSIKKEIGGIDYIKELVAKEFGVRCKEDLPLLINDSTFVGICARRVMRGNI